MKFGFDLHGVITKYTEPLLCIITCLMQEGHEIHIMTGSRGSTFVKELEELNIEIDSTHFFSVSDHIADHHPEEIDFSDPDHPWVENKELWDRVKGEYAAREGLDIVFDDTEDYGKYFTTPFVHINNSKECTK